MKKFRIILIAALCLAPLGLRAQDGNEYKTHIVKWFEDINSIAKEYNVDPQDIIDFNGLKNSVLQRRQELKIPLKKIKDFLSATGDAVQDAAQQVAEKLDSTSTSLGGIVEQTLNSIFNKPVEHVNATLILPFSSGNGINGSNYNFYSGVLLALKDLSARGTSTDLNVYDMPGSANPVNTLVLGGSNIIIGPLSTANISTVLSSCPSNKYIISPLDSRAAALAERGEHVIQAPSSTDAQYADIINWIKEDSRSGDRVVLFTEKNATPTALASRLKDSGLEYSTVSYGILEGRNILDNLLRIMTDSGTNRVVIASDNEAFVNDVVRNLNLMVFKEYDVILFGPSKIKNFETIEVESLHNTHLHMSSSYYVNYESNSVKSFLMAYRALFNAEPDPYAFQGYDIARFFISMYADYGSDWIRHLDQLSYSGLQSDFNFIRTSEGGYVNKAVRRVVYDTDWSIRLLK